jgi:hypothetical protein
MIDILFDWPAGARFGSRVPKERFYERSASNAVLRRIFVAEVQRISWMYKLAEETINLPATLEVPEIEVLWLDVKAHDVDNSVLAAIDKAIPNPIIFEVHRDGADGRTVRMAAAPKTALRGSPQRSDYFSTGWVRADTPRAPMPTAFTIPALYSSLIAPLAESTARPGEPVSEITARLSTVRRFEREISALERRLRSEPQLNRKLDLRRDLIAKQAELEQQR